VDGNLLLRKGENMKRLARRQATSLQNEMRGWKADMAQQQQYASFLSVVLVLLVTVQYSGALTPPGGLVTKEENGKTTPMTAPGRHELITFYLFNAIAFACSVAGLLILLLSALYRSHEGQVSKAIETFGDYVRDSDEKDFNFISDENDISKTYAMAVANNISKTLGTNTMRRRLGHKHREHTAWFVNKLHLQASTPVVPCFPPVCPCCGVAQCCELYTCPAVRVSRAAPHSGWDQL
jgi:hypothetical protein